METTPILLNLVACIVATIFTMFALYRLEQRHRDTEFSFLFYAVVCWLLAWGTWVVFWCSQWLSVLKHLTVGNTISTVLSDLNTCLMIMFYLGLTRGKELRISAYVMHGLMIFIFVGIADGALLLFPDNRLGTLLHDRWSLALSMFAPFLIGWGIRLRFGSSWVLVVGTVYALMQPPTYEAVLEPNDGPLSIMSMSTRSVILGSLAVLKILYASAVIYVIGLQPASSEAVVQVPTAASSSFQDKWWPKLPILLTVVGLISVVCVFLSRQTFPSDFATRVPIWIAAIAGVLTIFKLITDIVLKVAGER